MSELTVVNLGYGALFKGEMPNILKMNTKKPFESRMTVMRVRMNYIAPYRKAKYFYLEKKNLKNITIFKKHANSIVKNWPNGTYYLKLSNGLVFARFDVYDGKVKQVHKESPATGRGYPIWDWLKKKK